MAATYTISLRAEQVVMLRNYLRQVLDDPERHGIVRMLLGGILYDLEQLPVAEMPGLVAPDAPPLGGIVVASEEEDEPPVPSDDLDALG